MNTTKPELTPIEMIDEMEKAFPQLSESFERLRNLYNRTDEMKQELQEYQERAGFCTNCGDVFRHSELKNGLCPEDNFELYERHSGDEPEEELEEETLV